MTTLERINALFECCTIIGNPRVIARGDRLHEKLNVLDSAVGADTEWLRSTECGCLWHIGKTCDRRRAVGARVRMLEEIISRKIWEADYHRRGLRVSSRGVVTQG